MSAPIHAILLFAHGSTLCGAGETLFDLARRLEARGDAPIVEVGFLNYSEPPFEAAFQKCVERGAQKIIIAPYFLVAGYFVKVSLPPKIAAMQEQFPYIEVQVAQALQTHELLADAVQSCAARAQKPGNWRDILDNAPQFCRNNPECPLFDTLKCPHRSVAKGNKVTRSEVIKSEDHQLPLHVATLLVMVHGSPRPESNRDMFAVVEIVRDRRIFADIEVGFMECNEPDIPTALENLVARGAKKVVAVPYFLHSGTHVADDLPTILEAAQEKFPDVEFLMGDFLGRDELVADVVAQRVKEQM